MQIYKSDIKRTPVMMIGFIVLALGIHLTVIASIGSSSWSVLHQGLENSTGISFGLVTLLLGLVIMVMSIVFLNAKIGIGTILNVALVGPFIDLFDLVLPDSFDIVWQQIIVFAIGMVLMTFGRALYISSHLGPGPRDSLFVGFARITKIDVKYVKPAVEIIVLIIGIIFGGVFGVGTIIAMLFSGYMVQFFFKILKFDPKSTKQSNIVDYFRKVDAN